MAGRHFPSAAPQRRTVMYSFPEPPPVSCTGLDSLRTSTTHEATAVQYPVSPQFHKQLGRSSLSAMPISCRNLCILFNDLQVFIIIIGSIIICYLILNCIMLNRFIIPYCRCCTKSFTLGMCWGFCRLRIGNLF